MNIPTAPTRTRRGKRRRLLASLGLAALTMLAALAVMTASVSAAAPARGSVVSAKSISHLGKAEIEGDLRKLGIDAHGVRVGVDAYRIVYRTVGVAGEPTTASGLLVLPDDRRRVLPTADFEHGTQSARWEAPSAGTVSDGYISSMILGSAGFATVAPDYLGLGVGPGLHPYLDAASEVAASVDMLRAAHTVAASKGRQLDRRIYLTGFSQGGAASIALAHELQDHQPSGFTVAELDPISGPYDLRGVELPDALAGRLDPAVTPFYVGYLLTAWSRLGEAPSPAEAFQPPYDVKVRHLFDGSVDLPGIAKALPKSLDELLTPEALAELRSPTGAFAKAFQESEVCVGWRPDVPVHLWAARGDRTVPIGNARSCAKALRASGAQVELTDVGNVDHDHSAFIAVPRIAGDFRAAAAPRFFR